MFNIEQYISYNSILEFVKTNNILFTVFITILIVKLKDVSKSNVYLAGIVYFTGTFFHELAHYIAALITTLRFPEKVSLFPKSEVINGKKHINLGYVRVKDSHINIFNAFIIGMAPLSLLYLAYLVPKYFFVYYISYFQIGITAYILQSFLIATLIINSVPSRADFILARTKGSLYFYIVSISIFIAYIVITGVK
ncbi:hypothetical protein [Aliarcobacter butzleri]|uniref:hypothetical protein n=1 Tax=Aliarcobacter butzleri TaxID=28197 RepID=UPI0021B272D2|nr:hypothetical protein [Aliarcobacter butzleri]MCT7563138.1 hypothetical protein [Aliarcobacter butzleri]MCT7578613.1 hypothetical protein [Aliarcobacter butzleri]